MPQTCVKMPSGLCECVWPPRMPPPHGVRMVTGAQKSPGAAIPQARELGEDLVARGVDVVGELHFRDRAQSVHAHADRGTDDRAFGDRRVEHAVLAVLALQPVGDAEHAAEVADVLAQHDHVRVTRQHDVHGGVERLDHVHLCHSEPLIYFRMRRVTRAAAHHEARAAAPWLGLWARRVTTWCVASHVTPWGPGEFSPRSLSLRRSWIDIHSVLASRPRRKSHTVASMRK